MNQRHTLTCLKKANCVNVLYLMKMISKGNVLLHASSYCEVTTYVNVLKAVLQDNVLTIK